MTLPVGRVVLGLALACPIAHSVAAQSPPTIAQFMSPASPLELVAARKADRLAWIAYERGMRNVYTAAAPAWRPVRITRFLEDDGQELSGVVLSDDGSLAVFVRGAAPNRVGWVANPTHRTDGAERAIWAARTDGSGAWRLAEGASPELSPDGRTVLYVRDGQIYRVRTTRVTPDSLDRGLKPLITAWGAQSGPRWSPDGAHVAFVSSRGDHSFIALYDVRSRTLRYVAPSVDCDASPAWSTDGKRLAFTRRPGTPFGAQSQPGSGGIGNPPGAAAAGSTAQCGASALARANSAADSTRLLAAPPGLNVARFEDGSTLRIMVADVAAVGDIESNAARVLWHNQPDEKVFTGIQRLLWAGDQLVFPLSPAADEWDRWWAMDTRAAAPVPRLLTTTDGLIEGATSAILSADGKTLYYTTNAEDIERRHIWAVDVAGGAPRQLSRGEGIETYPQPLASGRNLAALYFGAQQPASVALLPAAGGEASIIFPQLPADFPKTAHVTPEIVVIDAPDSAKVHNQLFLPRDLKPGERRPAIVFVHGGPMRQMLPGYHYMQFYHWAYAFNQWLASQGYVVLSVNYRSGIGYGRSFRQAANTNRRGNSEYQDVRAAGLYLQTRADVDPARIGIWGLSYGGLLTAQALARDSDLFVAGVDLAGVHLYGSSIDTADIAFRSSAASQVAGWRSPVLLVHGDDDRNVSFAQTVGLVQLLRARGVHHELIVIPDDVHESMLHRRWLYTWDRMGSFLHRFVRDRSTATR
jgi:dipeptidyl aminopeptidase/acylaminoacyl peptidase